MSDLIHNERVKLTATWVNSIAAAAIAVGVIATFIAIFTVGLPVLTAVALSLIWFAIGVILHWMGRRSLGALKP